MLVAQDIAGKPRAMATLHEYREFVTEAQFKKAQRAKANREWLRARIAREPGLTEELTAAALLIVAVRHQRCDNG